ncbi:unnamed protein product, partial [Rangifer tarandus platyrhynchus]
MELPPGAYNDTAGGAGAAAHAGQRLRGTLGAAAVRHRALPVLPVHHLPLPHPLCGQPAHPGGEHPLPGEDNHPRPVLHQPGGCGPHPCGGLAHRSVQPGRAVLRHRCAMHLHVALSAGQHVQQRLLPHLDKLRPLPGPGQGCALRPVPHEALCAAELRPHLDGLLVCHSGALHGRPPAAQRGRVLLLCRRPGGAVAGGHAGFLAALRCHRPLLRAHRARAGERAPAPWPAPAEEEGSAHDPGRGAGLLRVLAARERLHQRALVAARAARGCALPALPPPRPPAGRPHGQSGCLLQQLPQTAHLQLPRGDLPRQAAALPGAENRPVSPEPPLPRGPEGRGPGQRGAGRGEAQQHRV